MFIASHHFNKIIHISVSTTKLYQFVRIFVLHIVIENRGVFDSNDEQLLSYFFLVRESV